mgnify:CR=1 FL=1
MNGQAASQMEKNAKYGMIASRTNAGERGLGPR